MNLRISNFLRRLTIKTNRVSGAVNGIVIVNDHADSWIFKYDKRFGPCVEKNRLPVDKLL
jgi:hypothetical protein